MDTEAERGEDDLGDGINIHTQLWIKQLMRTHCRAPGTPLGALGDLHRRRSTEEGLCVHLRLLHFAEAETTL